MYIFYIGLLFFTVVCILWLAVFDYHKSKIENNVFDYK